jgi:tetratricopeptide (TPR) repeat protein
MGAGQRRAPNAPPSVFVEGEDADADAGELVMSEQDAGEKEAPGEPQAVAADGAKGKPSTGTQAAEQTAKASEEAIDLEPVGASTTAAVSPKWSGTRSQKSGVQRATAILFGLAAVLALVVLAIWLRSRPRLPAELLPRPSVVKGDKEDKGIAPAGGGGSLKPMNPNTDTPTHPAVKPASPAGAAPAGAAAGASTPAPAKPDPGKEAKVLLAKAKKALTEDNAEAALLYADQSLELRKSPRAHLTRSQALQAIGRAEDALAAVDRSIAMSDDFAEGWLSRGLVLDMLSRTGEARAAFARYLELQPTGTTADEIRKRLAQ